jgi:23S rRNA (guanosine2251-2'-O)-methyltransferase
MTELLYGRQAVVEALRAGRRKIAVLLVAKNARRKGVLAESIALAEERGIPVRYVPRDQLLRVQRMDEQGIVAEAGEYPYVDIDTLLAAIRHSPLGNGSPLGHGLPLGHSLVLVLDRVQDPQNVGTLLRTAEAVAVDGVIIPEHRAASITPAVVNASSGATEHLRIARVTNVTRTLERLKQAGLWVAGLESLPEAQDYTQADLGGPLALVVGSEGQGISRLVRETCDFLVRLPMGGKIGSLNVAVAASITLYEIARQRRT